MKHFSEISATAERVVDAAESLIQERGYNGFSYDDVAKLVGIKKPSIHHHFATKGELAAVVAQRYTHRFKESLLQIEGHHVKAQDRLTAYADLFEKTFSTNKHLCVCGMLGAESSSLPDLVNHEVERFFDVNVDWLTHIAQDGQRAGQLLSVLSPEGIAETYLSILEGAMIVGRGMQKGTGPSHVASHFLKALTIA
ncbi:TetR/AcrR family transcriptional regulator [Undibacterium jejuense]|uniref:TetR/AcrR family transcriptional regulator n=1 Tax=Undibacterium jejuense TaxID=1344949 RepID=A0A923HJS7_9BURK|nr:TetR/AcrR family transcriptional regulator [Undibacterium jejuense]MBC3860976.1 TetR/AcrR family transcriptional regulator [Undibacterium jejuense]